MILKLDCQCSSRFSLVDTTGESCEGEAGGDSSDTLSISESSKFQESTHFLRGCWRTNENDIMTEDAKEDTSGVLRLASGEIIP